MTAFLTHMLSLGIGYLFGLFQTAFIYGKCCGIDIRTVGSGNSGATNALRNLGLKAGLTVFVGDVLKCVLAICLTRFLFAGDSPAMREIVTLYTGFGCILGHNFPFYMNFKGGKGVACSFAVALMINWPVALIGMAVFFAIFFSVHYVSVGSLTGLTLVYGTILFRGLGGVFGLSAGQKCQYAMIIVVILFMAFWQHRENIRRLRHHSENKTYFTRKKGGS